MGGSAARRHASKRRCAGGTKGHQQIRGTGRPVASTESTGSSRQDAMVVCANVRAEPCCVPTNLNPQLTCTRVPAAAQSLRFIHTATEVGATSVVLTVLRPLPSCSFLPLWLCLLRWQLLHATPRACPAHGHLDSLNTAGSYKI